MSIAPNSTPLATGVVTRWTVNWCVKSKKKWHYILETLLSFSLLRGEMTTADPSVMRFGHCLLVKQRDFALVNESADTLTTFPKTE
jgi:hypothetical protein